MNVKRVAERRRRASIRREMKDQLPAVEAVLREWDPIGVITELVEDGLPPDEYDDYAPVIEGMLRRGCSRDELASYLSSCRVRAMGLRPNDEVDRAIADKLVALPR